MSVHVSERTSDASAAPVFESGAVCRALAVAPGTFNNWIGGGLLPALSAAAQDTTHAPGYRVRHLTLLDAVTVALAKAFILWGIHKRQAFGLAKVCATKFDEHRLNFRFVFIARPDIRHYEIAFSAGPNPPDRAWPHLAVDLEAITVDTVDALKAERVTAERRKAAA